VSVAELAAQACGDGALGGEVVVQGQDAYIVAARLWPSPYSSLMRWAKAS
jgi:hypothetical protein